jgi:hypothetical protein
MKPLSCLSTPITQGLLAIGLASTIAFAPTTACANLLIEGAFDLNSPLTNFSAVLGPPFHAGQWAVENAQNLSGLQPDGVMPQSDGRMLCMLDDGLVLTQAGQAVPVIAGTEYVLGASFTTGTNVSGAIGGLILTFYGGNVNTLLADFELPVSLNADTAWQSFSLKAVAPTGSKWVVAQVDYNNASLGTNTGYVDNASLTAVPEPVSMALLGVGLGVLLLARRKAA